MNLPDSLIKTLHEVHENAATWLLNFPAYLTSLETRWHIKVTGLVEDLSFNIVAFAKGQNGTDYVLKMSPPGVEFVQELTALELYNGDGIARLIKADREGGAMLLERLRPGVSFWRTTDDELATRTCAELLLRLWRPVKSKAGLRDLTSWTRALPDYLEQCPSGGGFLPQPLVDKANSLLGDLLAETSEQVLLHGDLHHGNILSATRAAYLAIDPKGIVGSKGFDVTAFLFNPDGLTKRHDFTHLLARRLALFSEMLDLSQQVIAMWGYMFAALSSCWSGAEHDPSANIAVAEELERHF